MNIEMEKLCRQVCWLSGDDKDERGELLEGNAHLGEEGRGGHS